MAHRNMTEIKERWQINVDAFLSNDPEALAIGPKGSKDKIQGSTNAIDLMRAICHCLALVGAPLWRFTTGPWIHQRTLVINMDDSTTRTAAVNYMINHLGLRQAVLVDEFNKQGPGSRVQGNQSSVMFVYHKTTLLHANQIYNVHKYKAAHCGHMKSDHEAH